MKRIGLIGLIVILGLGLMQRSEAELADWMRNLPCIKNSDGTWTCCLSDGTLITVACAKIKISTGNMGPGVSIRPGFFRIEGDQLTPSIYSPVALGFVADYSIKTVSHEKTSGGVPRIVSLYQKAGIEMGYRFDDGDVAGAPTYADEATMRSRLQMVDAEGWSCTNNPAYYDLYPGDGEMYRFVAATNSENYLQLVLHRTVTGREETLGQIGVELVRDADGLLRQVLVPTRLCDVVVSNEWEYAIKFYRRADVGMEKNGEGLYVPASNAVPVEVWTISNPEPTTLTKLKVAQSIGGKTNIYDYVYEPDSGDWTLASGGGLKSKTIERVEDDSRTLLYRTHITRGQRGEIVERIREKIQRFSIGAGVVESVNDPDGAALTTSYTYDAAGRTMTKQEPDGNWVSYTYDGNGRVVTEVSPWKDSSFDSPVNSARVIYYDYTPVVAGDAVLFNDQRPRMVTEKVLGVTVAKTFHAYVTNSAKELMEVEEKCVSGSASYGDANSLRMVKTYYGTNTLNYKIGRLKSVQYPDGPLDTYDYEYGNYHASTNPTSCWFEPDPDGEAWRETMIHGTADHPEGIADKTTRDMKVMDGYNQEVLSETYVYTGANYERIAWTARKFDDFYHPIHEYRSNGEQVDASWGGNCCGKEWDKTADGVEKTYGYDLLNRLTSVTKKGTNSPTDDFKREHTFDALNRRLTEKISGGALSLLVSSNKYDMAGRIVQSIDSADLVTSYQYHDGGRVTTTVRPGNATNITENYLDGRTKGISGNAVVAQSYDYGVNGDGTRWTKVYSGQAGTASPMWKKITIDLLGRTIREERLGFGGVVFANTTIYNAKGQIIKTTVSGTADTLYSYDELGNRIFSVLNINGDGQINMDGVDRVNSSGTYYQKEGNDWFKVDASAVYADEGSPVATTNNIRKTRLTGMGELSGMGLSTTESMKIDALGNVTTSRAYIDVDAKTKVQLIDYPDSTNDALIITCNGLPIRSVSKTGVKTGFGYDSLERRIWTDDQRKGRSVTHYDSQGRIDYVEDAVGNRTGYGYDSITGRKISTTDAMSNKVYMGYDVRGKLVRTWGATYPVSYSYDEYGRMESMTTYRGGSGWDADTWPSNPGTGDTAKWLYDEATGLLTNKVYADGKGSVYGYAPDGQLASRLWARGIMTTYSYTNSGELVKIDYSDMTPDVMFTYDRLGRQKNIADGQGTRSFGYDEYLQLVAETNTLGLMSRNHDAHGRVTGFDLTMIGDAAPSYSVDYSYSDDGRFSGISSSIVGLTNAWTYSYLPNSDFVSGRSNSVGEGTAPLAVTRVYEDHRDLLTQVKNITGTNILSQFDYQNDAIGRRARRLDTMASSVTNDFGYNVRSELTEAAMGTNHLGYAYDPIGNRMTSTANGEQKTYTANNLNQYAQITNGGLVNLSYDPDGNLTNDSIFAYSWDGENRLIGVTPLAPTNGAKRVRCSYDYMSRRVEKAVDVWDGSTWVASSTNFFVYDGWNLVSEICYLPDEVRTNWFVWGLDLSSTLQRAGGIGGLLCVSQNGVSNSPAMFFPFFDANGNITDYVDANGILLTHFIYNPFGNLQSMIGDTSCAPAFRFSTKYADKETGLYYYGYRYYSPGIGVFLNRDLMEEMGGPNVNVALKNSPVNNIDLLGLITMIPLYPPKDDLKCALVMLAMDTYSLSTPANRFLWNRWLSNRGGEEWISYDWFDPNGTLRQNARQMVENRLDMYIQRLSGQGRCNATRTYHDSFDLTGTAGLNLMINVWNQKTEYFVSYGKNCIGNCCASLWAKATIFNTASDKTDFNNGQTFTLPPFTIADALVNECFNSGNNDFNIKSMRAEELEKAWQCP